MIRRLLLACAVCWTWFGSLNAAEPDLYLQQIKPLFQKRCYACHGGLKQEASLRLDTAAAMLQGGDSGPVVRRGEPAKSLLVERVAAADPGERMPPEHEGESLTDAQVALVRQWITAGAPAPADEQPEADPEQHWAFQPLVRPAVPAVAGAKVQNPIDAFLAKQRLEKGLTAQREAPRVLLLRRLYLDLIGLPPTAEQIAAFEQDQAPDWYERQVEQLLEDPRHGERWARHWMDIWRYSDWWGLGAQLRNSQKHIWHWRDWIVESLNADTPYDEMVKAMLAADELHPGDLQQLRATGFLARNYFLFNRHQWMEETVEHVGKGFLGLTLNCAKCHDHKFDPIAQEDFYRMRAFFEPYHVRLDLPPGETDVVRDGIPRVYDGLLEEPTYLFIRGQESNPDKSKPLTPGVPKLLAFDKLEMKTVQLPAVAWQPARQPWVIESHLQAAHKNVAAAQAALQQATKHEPKATPDAEDEPPAPEPPTEIAIAELALHVAQAELQSVESRGAAMQARWQAADQAASKNAAALTAAADEKNRAAVRAEKAVTVAQARKKLAETQRRLRLAASDKKSAAVAEVQAAQQALAKAEAALEAPLKDGETYTPMKGAQWTATRFQFSGRDDPLVAYPPTSTGRRSALAAWITDRRNPLTARVAVNHIWSRHMGRPLVASVFDFGRNGSEPTHPALLDWLAMELIDSGWSMKHLHRLITASAAYRMESSNRGQEANLAIDPDNHSWWRRQPIRVESQVVRDAILSLSGELDLTRGGPTIPPEQQAASKRRSLYFFHSFNSRNPLLTTFDEAAVKDCYRRDQSIVPQQALALANSRLVLDSLAPIAQQLSDRDDSTFINEAFRVLLGTTPSEAERAASLQAMKAWRELPGQTDPSRTYLIWTLLNHNDFITLR